MARLLNQVTVAVTTQILLLGGWPQSDVRAATFSYEQATMHRRPSSLVPPLPGEPVPEPGTSTALALAGLGALGFKLRQRQTVQKKLIGSDKH